MKVSEGMLKWLMRLYPPLFFQRIWVKRFHPGFRGVDVIINNSILNRNYNSSIFGGSIFAAADPFYPILFDRIFKQKGFKTLVWLKSSSIQYLKPAKSDLHFTIEITNDDVKSAEKMLNETGKFVATFQLRILNAQSECCVLVENEVYVRNLQYTPPLFIDKSSEIPL